MIRLHLHTTARCRTFLVRVLAGSLALGLLWLPQSRATVPLSGRLVAEHACAAVVSIKKGSNPDSARLVPGRSYEVLGKNREREVISRSLALNLVRQVSQQLTLL